jgi:cyclophilin family peptidyl-prolyl cis-trans isomerase
MTARHFIRLLLPAMSVLCGFSPLARAVAPAAPSDCTAVAYDRTASQASITVSWTDSSNNETSWVVQYSIDNGPYNLLNTYASSDTPGTGARVSVSLGSVPLDTVFRFRIAASNGTELSPVSNIATVGTFELARPINFNVAVLDPFNVALNWEEGSTSESGFSLEIKVGSGPWAILGTIDSNTLFVGPVNLIEPLLSYQFRIRAYNGGAPTTPDSAAGSTAVSPYSDTVAVNSGAFTLSAAVVPGQAAVNLSWPNILNETGYQIYILLPGSSAYQLLQTVAANVSVYQVAAPIIEPAKSYSFIVAPVAGTAFMGESSEAFAIVDGITSKTGTSGTPGSPLIHAFTQVSGSTVSSRALSGVPAGLLFDTATGVLSGVYPAVGNYILNYTVNLTNGGVLTQAFSVRVRPSAGPPLVGTLIPAWTGSAGSSRDTPLAGTFTDPEAESAVRVDTTLGTMDFILFDGATPATVANFMSYVNSGKYADVAFHRSIAGFVIQGGGFKGAGTGSNFTSVVTDPPVVNEPGIANERGTVSMAKVGGNPNSATSQFFVSLGDNRANLDYQNGGFTVFGRVAGNGMAVADAIGNRPTATYNLFLDGSASATPFGDFPMNAPVPPSPMDQTKLVKMNSVTPIPTLSYSITGNTHPSVASASIVGGQLRLVGLSGGQTTITVTATDLDNLSSNQTVLVDLSDTYSSWAARNSFPGGQSGIDQNPDGDPLSNLEEYAFFGDPGDAGSGSAPVLGWTGASPDPRFMTLTFPLRKFTDGLAYVVEANEQLTGTWSAVWSSADGLSHPQVLSAVDQADRTVVTIRDNVAIGGRQKRFLRTRVVQQ